MAIPRILGKKLTPIQILIGIDMGSALAPCIFCMAIDPIIRHLNQIPNSITNGYMDDATSIVDDIRALKRGWETWKRYEATGQVIAGHTGKSTKGPRLTVIRKTPQTREGRDLGTLDNNDDLAELISKEHRTKCACKPKVETAVILRRKPTAEQLAGINDTPQRPLVLCNNAKKLQAYGAHQQTVARGRQKHKITKAAKIEIIYDSYIQPLKEKVRRIEKGGGSFVERIKYWTSYVRAGLNYPATQALPDASTNKEILALQAMVLGTMGWLDEEFAAQVYQALNIVTADTAEQSFRVKHDTGSCQRTRQDRHLWRQGGTAEDRRGIQKAERQSQL